MKRGPCIPNAGPFSLRWQWEQCLGVGQISWSAGPTCRAILLCPLFPQWLFVTAVATVKYTHFVLALFHPHLPMSLDLLWGKRCITFSGLQSMLVTEWVCEWGSKSKKVLLPIRPEEQTRHLFQPIFLADLSV